MVRVWGSGYAACIKAAQRHLLYSSTPSLALALVYLLDPCSDGDSFGLHEVYVGKQIKRKKSFYTILKRICQPYLYNSLCCNLFRHQNPCLPGYRDISKVIERISFLFLNLQWVQFLKLSWEYFLIGEIYIYWWIPTTRRNYFTYSIPRGFFSNPYDDCIYYYLAEMTIEKWDLACLCMKPIGSRNSSMVGK